MWFRLALLAQVEKPAEVQEIIGQKRLRDKVSGILERIEKELDSVESKIGESMHVLDTDNDGMVSTQAVQPAIRAGFLMDVWMPLCVLFPLASRQETAFAGDSGGAADSHGIPQGAAGRG